MPKLKALYCKKTLFMDGEPKPSFILGKQYKVMSSSIKITKSIILSDEDRTAHTLDEWHIHFQVEPINDIEAIMFKMGYET
jgi:hypothetical protein